MLIEKLINVAGIGIGVAVITAYNDHAGQAMSSFFGRDPYGETSRLLQRVLHSGDGFTGQMASYASDNVPMFCFGAVALVLVGAMFKS